MMQKSQTTIKDIARELQISHSTVSRALSEDQKVSALVAEQTRKRVQQKAAELDYSPNLMAQGFVTGKTRTLGLLTYEIFWETFARQADQILKAADKQKYQVLMGLATNRRQEFPLENQVTQIRQFLSRGIEGLLIHTRGDAEESERIVNAVSERVPVVTFTSPIKDLSGIVVDMIMSFCEVTEHLIRLGHERIGFIGTDWNTDFVGSAKGKGYLLAMKKHGLAPQLIPGRTYPARAIYDLVKRLDDQFTALVCRSDYTAIGVCRGLREVGIRVPEDVAVVGYGNLEVAAFVTPPLTTLATPYEEIAERAMELMLEQLEGQDTPRPPRQITLQTSLIVRKSCGGRR